MVGEFITCQEVFRLLFFLNLSFYLQVRFF